MHYIHKKARCEPEIATFRTKTLHFFRVIRLNWWATIELRWAQAPDQGFIELPGLPAAAFFRARSDISSPIVRIEKDWYWFEFREHGKWRNVLY